MKKILLFLLSIALLAAFSVRDTFAQEPVGPKMVLENLVFDFKDVNEGKIIEHSFRVYNRGDRTLEIKKVKPG